jgi:hypothetical protein
MALPDGAPSCAKHAGLEPDRALAGTLGRRCASEKIATVDQDATIIESRKQEATRTYEGDRGYQPMLAY